MGQYYKCIILAEKGTDGEDEYIRTHVNPHMFGEGAKLIEHSYHGTEFMQTVEHLLCYGGPYYKSRVVWAGDYADKEPDSDENLYSSIPEDNNGYVGPTGKHDYPYIINHTKKLYVMKINMFHPLPILTAEGNGRGGGDYHGEDEDLVGTWARDVISVGMHAPEDYTMLIHNLGGSSSENAPSTP